MWALLREGAPRIPLLRERVPSARLLYGDLRDQAAIRTAVRTAEPDQVYNLAAFSSAGRT